MFILEEQKEAKSAPADSVLALVPRLPGFESLGLSQVSSKGSKELEKNVVGCSCCQSEVPGPQKGGVWKAAIQVIREGVTQVA